VNLSLVVVLAVFVLIAVRQVGNVRLQIWQIMSLGALVVLAAGEISPADAWFAINLDVLVFLFAMFVVGQALEESGYLDHFSYKFFKRARSRDSMILMVLFGSGLLSALLMNDVVAIMGTPVVLLLGRRHAMKATVLLLTLPDGSRGGKYHRRQLHDSRSGKQRYDHPEGRAPRTWDTHIRAIRARGDSADCWADLCLLVLPAVRVTQQRIIR